MISESIDEFWTTFNKRVAEFRQELGKRSERNNESRLKELLFDLQSFANNTTSILPQYDIRRSQEVSNS